MWLFTRTPLAWNVPHLRVKIEMKICKKEFLGFCWLAFSVGLQFALWRTWGLQVFIYPRCLRCNPCNCYSNKQCNESIALLQVHWSVHVTFTKTHHRQPASYLSTSRWWRHKVSWHRRENKGKTHTCCWWSPIGTCSEGAGSTKEERSGDSKHPCLSPTPTVNSCDLTSPTLTQTFEQEYSDLTASNRRIYTAAISIYCFMPLYPTTYDYILQHSATYCYILLYPASNCCIVQFASTPP